MFSAYSISTSIDTSYTRTWLEIFRKIKWPYFAEKSPCSSKIARNRAYLYFHRANNQQGKINKTDFDLWWINFCSSCWSFKYLAYSCTIQVRLTGGWSKEESSHRSSINRFFQLSREPIPSRSRVISRTVNQFDSLEPAIHLSAALVPSVHSMKSAGN